jgi:retinol dehydrogenase-14
MDMSDRICLVTGSNSGIGKETARELARMNATVVMLVRNKKKGELARDEIVADTGNHNVEIMVADLLSLKEIRRFAADYGLSHDRLDVLVNNAGGIFSKRQMTEDGNEYTIALNYLAPFYLTHELLGLLSSSSSARIVNVASAAHTRGKINLNDFQNKKFGFLRAYGTAKLMNIMFTYELARRLSDTGITVNAVHPGFVNTNFGKKDAGRARIAVMKLISRVGRSPEEGAKTSIYLASSPEVEGITGKYFADCKEHKSSTTSYDLELQNAVWTKTEETLGIDSWSYISMMKEKTEASVKL